MVVPPELGDISFKGETHQIVIDLYEAMKNSAQRRFYEYTDWHTARFMLLALNEELIASRHMGKPMGAMKLTALNQIMSTLMLTEGDRRRVKLEIERNAGPTAEGGKVLTMADHFKQELQKQVTGTTNT